MFFSMQSHCEMYQILTRNTNTSFFLYNHKEASVKFFDFANQDFARMVSQRLRNFAGTKYTIPITAYRIFSTKTDTTPLVLILP